jgi:hypothetical protein
LFSLFIIDLPFFSNHPEPWQRGKLNTGADSIKIPSKAERCLKKHGIRFYRTGRRVIFSKERVMSDFFEAKSLTEEEQKKLLEEVETIIARKMKEGLLTSREIREIEEMKLRPLPDIQDVQSVYENFLFEDKKRDREGGPARTPARGGSDESGK